MMAIVPCTLKSAYLPISTSPWRGAAIRLTAYQNHEHICIGSSYTTRRSARAQWYFRNSRPGHKEGGEVRFLWSGQQAAIWCFPLPGVPRANTESNKSNRLQGCALWHAPAVYLLHNSNLQKGTSHERDQELSAGRHLPCDFGTTHWLRARWHQTGDCPSEQHRKLL